MKQAAVLTAVLGVFADNALAQGTQCQGSRNRWGLSQYRQNSDSLNCWLNWSGWSECTGHCGHTVKTANRKCRGNIPGMGGCAGSELKRKRCSESELVQGKETYCPYWSFWAPWSDCQVEASTDPCVWNTQGLATRQRVCHDPYASERGETPKCQGEESESRVCQGSASFSAPTFEVIGDLPAGYTYGEPWSDCSKLCGRGIQKCRLVHICAGNPYTWVEKADWYVDRERPCHNSCCVPGEWKKTEEPAQCFNGRLQEVRPHISIIGGINDAKPGQDCSALAKLDPNFRRGPGNQYMEVISTLIPVVFPVPISGQFYGNEPQWSICTEQESPYNKLVRTTCGVNGYRTRTWKHHCSQECERKAQRNDQWNQWSARAVAGSECETWLSQPYFYHEKEPCGPQAEKKTSNTCDENPCKPVCYEEISCGNEVLLKDEVPCQPDVCGPLPLPQCDIPLRCGCGQELTTRTCHHHCKAPTVEQLRCPLPQVKRYTDGQWIETPDLKAARDQGICVCKDQEEYMDFKYELSRTTAENGEICADSDPVKTMTKNNDYLKESCLSDEICDGNMCDRQCDYFGQEPQMYTCYKQDACLSPSKNRIQTATRQCPPKPSCCGWSEWENRTDCLNNFQCPSEASGMRQRTRGEINLMTRQKDENCGKIDVDEVACPRTACPTWPDWSEWSQCSYILPDGTVCGGNRNRARDYMCKNDVAQGNCLPSYGVGRTYSDGNFADPYNQVDSATENHHSSYCYNLYEENRSERAIDTTYLNGNQPVDLSQWQWVRDTVNNGCIAGNSTHYREIRNYQLSNKCITGEVESKQETREVAIQSCIKELIPETQLNSCEAGITSGPCCQYQNNGCSAVVQSMCIANDICAQSRPNMPIQASNVQCPVIDEPLSCDEGPCYQTQDPNDDFCAGESEQTCFMKCGTSYKQKTQCTIAPTWTDWTPFTAKVQFDISTGIQKPVITENALAPLTVTCNPCGGIVESKRTLLCSDEDLVPEDLRHQFRVVDCPAPQFAWSEWSQCGQTCANRPNERTCTQVRKLIASAGTEHCQEKQSETRQVKLFDCECGCSTRERVCRHQVDAFATCGIGHWHERVQHNTCKCTDDTQIISRGQVQYELLQNPVNGKVEECKLEFQPRYVPGMQSGCNTRDQICNGGVITQPMTFRCVEGNAPVGFQEKLEVKQVGECPEKPSVQIVEKRDDCQHQCQETHNIYRECLNGKFEDNCECMSYGRQCCQRNPEYTLTNNGTMEVKAIPCGIPPLYEQIRTPDPACKCGQCGESVCMRNPCTFVLSDCVETPSIKGSYAPEIHPLTECMWDAFAVGHDKCNTRGYQIKKTVHHCIDNIVQSPPKIDLEPVKYDYLTDSSTGFVYDTINGQNTTDVQNCLLQSKKEINRSDCMYSHDRCNPYRIVEHISICGGAETVTFTTQEPCVVQETDSWTDWTGCSVECGPGMMTRNFVQGCSGKVLHTENKPCGCGIARWSEWSQWDKSHFSPCGPEYQVRKSSRHCIPAQSNSYLYSQADEYFSYITGGYYPARIDSNIDAECANKCDRCFGEKVRQEALVPVKAEIIASVEPCPINPMDRCNKYEIKREVQCGKTISTQQIPCQLPAVPVHNDPECSVLCGPGTKTITTQASICEAPVTTTVPCQGRLGKVVDKVATAWSGCSKSCGGGEQTSYTSVVCELPDENNQVVEIRRKIAKQQCSMHPCAYWGGWSNWSMCSSTCGSGQQQRSRKCEGGPPGTGGCTGDSEFMEVNGQMQPFTPTANGALHSRHCDDGQCCDFEWSGWSNCCIEGSTQKRLRWKGNQCDGKWIKQAEKCDEGTNDPSTIRQCNSLYKIQQSYFTGYEQDTINITDIRVVEGRTSYTGHNVYYGRRIDDGRYTLDGQTYVLKNSGDNQIWYILNADNTLTNIEVERVESKTVHSGSTFYYRFGDTWYKYINNQFVYSPTPPAFYTGSQYASFQPHQTVNSYNSGFSADSASSPRNYIAPNQASTKSQFNLPNHYIMAQTPSLGYIHQDDFTIIKPVAEAVEQN